MTITMVPLMTQSNLVIDRQLRDRLLAQSDFRGQVSMTIEVDPLDGTASLHVYSDDGHGNGDLLMAVYLRGRLS